MNLYVDVAAFERRFLNSKPLKAEDLTEVLRVLRAASRAMDNYCGRFFYALTATKVFHGNGRDRMEIPDLLAATTVKLDEDENGTFELTLAAATDYWFEREGHLDVNATPKTVLRLNRQGSQGTLSPQPRLVEIVGRWGYTEETETVGTTNEALDATETGIDLTAAEGALYAVGQTLLIDNEQLYVSSVDGDRLTATRGVNGTTAATHLTAVTVKRFVYVPEVIEATLIEAGHLWERRKVPSATRIVNPVVGSIEMNRGTDPDVSELLNDFVRVAV